MEEPLGYIDVQTDDGRTVPLTVLTHTLVPSAQLAKNIAANIVRDVPRFVLSRGFNKYLPSERLAVVSSGHSLNEKLDELRTFENIMVCGSGHDHLVKNGIIPNYAVVCDAGKEDKGNLSLPQKDTLYLISSQCDPGLFDHLAGYNVEMWHYRGQAAPDLNEEAKLLNYEPSIAWGSSATIVSVTLAMMLGFQHLDFFGFDNCYAEYGTKYHACDVAGSYDYDKTPVHIGKRFFISNMALLEQAQQFFRVVEAWREHLHITLHGDGLTSEMVRQGDPGLQQFVSLA